MLLPKYHCYNILRRGIHTYKAKNGSLLPLGGRRWYVIFFIFHRYSVQHHIYSRTYDIIGTYHGISCYWAIQYWLTKFSCFLPLSLFIFYFLFVSASRFGITPRFVLQPIIYPPPPPAPPPRQSPARLPAQSNIKLKFPPIPIGGAPPGLSGRVVDETNVPPRSPKRSLSGGGAGDDNNRRRQQQQQKKRLRGSLVL